MTSGIQTKRRRRVALALMLVLVVVALIVAFKTVSVRRLASSGAARIGGPGEAAPGGPGGQSTPAPGTAGGGAGSKPAWGSVTLDRGQATQAIASWYAGSKGIRLQVTDITRVSGSLAEPPPQHVEVRLEGGRLAGPATLWHALDSGSRGDAKIVTHVAFEPTELPPEGTTSFVLPTALMSGDRRSVAFGVVPDFGSTVIRGTLTDSLHTTTFEIPVPTALQQVRYWRVVAPDPIRVPFSFDVVLPATAELTIDRGGDGVYFESPDGAAEQRVLLTVGPIDPPIFDPEAQRHITQVGGKPTITKEPTAILVMPRKASGEITVRIRDQFTDAEANDYFRQIGDRKVDYFQTLPWDRPAAIPIVPLADTQKPDGTGIITAPGIPAAPTAGTQPVTSTTARPHSVLPLVILVVAGVLGAMALRRRRKSRKAATNTEQRSD